jgi:hypothetical protein
VNKLAVGETILQRLAVHAKSRAFCALFSPSTLLPASTLARSASLKVLAPSDRRSMRPSGLYCLLSLVLMTLLAMVPAKAQYVCAPPWSGVKTISGTISVSSKAINQTLNLGGGATRTYNDDLETNANVVMPQTGSGSCSWTVSAMNTPNSLASINDDETGVPRIQWTAFLRDATVASNSSGLTPPRCVCRRVRL